MNIGFHNIDATLKNYRMVIDGKELGPIVSWRQCENACYWLRAHETKLCPLCGSNDLLDHSEFGLPIGHSKSCGSCKHTW